MIKTIYFGRFIHRRPLVAKTHLAVERQESRNQKVWTSVCGQNVIPLEVTSPNLGIKRSQLQSIFGRIGVVGLTYTPVQKKKP